MVKTNKYDETRPILTQIRELEPGDTIAFPIEKTAYLRSNLTLLRYKGLGFRSHVISEKDIIEITRTK